MHKVVPVDSNRHIPSIPQDDLNGIDTISLIVLYVDAVSPNSGNIHIPIYLLESYN